MTPKFKKTIQFKAVGLPGYKECKFRMILAIVGGGITNGVLFASSNKAAIENENRIRKFTKEKNKQVHKQIIR